MRDWIDVLGYHWLASIEKTVPNIEENIDVVPEGLLRNLMGAYDTNPERPLAGAFKSVYLRPFCAVFVRVLRLFVVFLCCFCAEK